MKKIGAILLTLILTVSLVGLVAAQNDNNSNNDLSMDEEARNCLKDRVDSNGCSSLNHEEIVFSLLSLANDEDIQRECRDALDIRECWTSGDCNVKDTALATLALNYIGENTEESEEWLLSQNNTATNLEWYLEIDSTEETTCSINYGQEAEVLIEENKLVGINDDPSNCFSSGFNGYWLRVNDDCLEKEFEISCDNGFVSTLIYRKENSVVWHVSGEAESGSANSTTSHQINSYCLGTNGCNYEGTLWAALALEQSGRDISHLKPYLNVLYEDNSEFFPSTFLFLLTNSDHYLSRITNLQDRDGFWDVGENKYYDTALALMALPETRTEDAISWLEDVQDSSGCWNNGNIRDTGILLWAGWPKSPASISDRPIRQDCESEGYYCMSGSACDEAGGEILRNYDCPSGVDKCCNREPLGDTCRAKDGYICGSSERCTGDLVTASDTSGAECCVQGECVPKESECERNEYFCQSNCGEGEQEVVSYSDSCGAGEVCCKEEDEPEEGGSYWWIILLIILIVLVVLGIIFRHKLRAFLFKLKNKFGKGKEGQSSKKPPKGPGSRPGKRRPPRKSPPRRRRPPRKKSQTDKELADTMNKLKKMQS